MATSLSTPADPLQRLREAVNTLEAGLNRLAASGIKTRRGALALHAMATVAMVVQRLLDAVSEDLLRRVNLPSRRQIDELTEMLRRIEDKLDRLQPADSFAAAVPRPPRTRRPAVAMPVPAAPAAAPASASAPRRRAPRRKQG